jgi:hypothetical protein
MKHVHVPRPLIIFILLLVAVTFLIGTLRAFQTSLAAASTATAIIPAKTSEAVPPTPTPFLDYGSGDTTGAIALAIVIVVIMLVGVAWGGRKPPEKTQKQK